MSNRDVQALAAEILAPGSAANTNERDAATLAVTWKANPRMMGLAAVEQLRAYYTRVHLGAMSTNLRAAGA